MTRVKTRRRRLGAAATLAILACSPVARVGAQQPDRSHPPAVGPVPALHLPDVQQFQLADGLTVYLMEKHTVPLVEVDLLVDAGSPRDRTGHEGLAVLTADMLDEGAGGRSSLDIAATFDRLGARFRTAANSEAAVALLRVPVARLDSALALMGTVVLHPDFPAAELERLRKERLTAMIRAHDQPGSIAGVLFDRTVFGNDHPYGRPTEGSPASVRAFTTDDVRAFYDTFYRPGNASIIIVGDITRERAERVLENALDAWPRGAAPPLHIPPAPQVKGRRILLVDKPGAAQSVITIGRIGAERTSPDYYALRVLNTILGGSFTSRLNQNLREQHGYSYGASSSFDFMVGAGPFTAGAAVQTNATGPALTEFMKELRGIRDPIPQAEFDRARNYLAMRYPAQFQSVAGTATNLHDLPLYGLPMDALSAYVQGIMAVRPEDVQRVADKYIDPDNLVIVVVGDRAAVEEQIRQQNIGPIEVLSVDDVLGPVPTLDGG